jgi:hypothetical protein
VSLGRRFLTSPDKGAETSVYLASSPNVSNISGEYFSNKKIAALSKVAQNEEYSTKVWDLSLEWSGIENYGSK